MDWYYARNNERQGPVSEETLRQLLESGEITWDALVWHEGMADWQPCDRVLAKNEAADVSCAMCGQFVPLDGAARYADRYVCVACKPEYDQHLREGLNPRSYAARTKPNAPTAMAGLICSVAGLVTCQLLCIVGILLSSRALRDCRENPEYGGESIARAGFIVGIIGTVIVVMYVLFFLVMFLIATA